jgi:hypothetical protein
VIELCINLIALIRVLTTVILIKETMAAIVPLKMIAGNFVSINANRANTNQGKSN